MTETAEPPSSEAEIEADFEKYLLSELSSNQDCQGTACDGQAEEPKASKANPGNRSAPPARDVTIDDTLVGEILALPDLDFTGFLSEEEEPLPSQQDHSSTPLPPAEEDIDWSQILACDD